MSAPAAERTPTVGFTCVQACLVAGITYRQLDYWARTGFVGPEVRPASGSGSRRLYSARDIAVLAVVRALLHAGIALEQIRTAVEPLRDLPLGEWADRRLVSDGHDVHEATSDMDFIELAAAGRAYFVLALGPVAAAVIARVDELAATPVEVPR